MLTSFGRRSCGLQDGKLGMEERLNAQNNYFTYPVTRGCLLVRQSFFIGDARNFGDLGGGVIGCRVFTLASATNGGLSLNMYVSTTMIMNPGTVLNFLIANQNLWDARQINWTKANRMLTAIRIGTAHNKMEIKITGISDLPCN